MYWDKSKRKPLAREGFVGLLAPILIHFDEYDTFETVILHRNQYQYCFCYTRQYGKYMRIYIKSNLSIKNFAESVFSFTEIEVLGVIRLSSQ